MTDPPPLPRHDTPQSRLPGPWKVRRVVALTAPVIVAALAAVNYALFVAVQEDPSGGSADIIVVYGVALLSPMGMTALIGFLFAYSTRGVPARGFGLLSVNLLLTVVLIVPAVLAFPLFLHVLPFLASDAANWVLARLGW